MKIVAKYTIDSRTMDVLIASNVRVEYINAVLRGLEEAFVSCDMIDFFEAVEDDYLLRLPDPFDKEE